MSYRLLKCIVLAVLLWPAMASTQDRANPPPEPLPAPEAAVQADTQGIQALTRGPVHEGFAEPVSIEPAPGPVVPKQPPEPIEEVAPEARPDNPDAEWIPGYWIWDDDQNDFVWISGIWRVPPSGMRWVPGYWTESREGFQRVSGLWTALGNAEVTYLPTPPETLEAGPNTPSPSEDHFWVPGCWVWADARYQWQAGYWSRVQPDFTWVPAHYVWTPRGCVFIHGYWDYPLERRGVIFAPVYFTDTIYRQPGFVFTPSIVINVPFLTSHFFVRPNYSHYYFGDYYANRYERFGFQPWFAFQRTRGWYDPVFVHHRWQHGRRGDDWDQRVKSNHQFFAQNEDLRPRHTFADQRQFIETLRVRQDPKITNNLVQQVALGTSVRDALRGDAQVGQRLASVPEAQRREISDRTRQIRDLAQQRIQTEAKADVRTAERAQAGAQARDLGRLKLPEAVGRTPGEQRPERTGDVRDRIGRPDTRTDAARPGDVGIPQPDRTPDTTRPRSDRPGVTLPDADRPKVDQPRVDAPRVDQPRVDQPRVDRPRVDRPRVDTPQVEQPRDRLFQPRERTPDPRGDRTTPQPRLDRPGATTRPELSPPPDRPRDRREATAPDRSPFPLPGAERQPDRIPGGNPGLGPSPNPSARTRPDTTPSLNDRRIPSTAPGIPGTGPGPRRPDQLPQVPQSGASARQPQSSAERQPMKPTPQGGNRLTIPSSPQLPERQATRPAAPQRGPSRVEAQRPVTPAPAPQVRPTPQPRPEARSAPQLRPEARPTPQPRPEARSAPAPAPAPQARPAPSGGGRPNVPAPNPGAGGRGGDRGGRGGDRDKDKK